MKLSKIFFLTTLICLSTSAQAPFSITSGLFEASNTNTLGLTKAEGTETQTIFAPTDDTDHFSHGAVMTYFKGVLYCMWQSSSKDEDASETWIAYSRSENDGSTWSKPMVLAPTIENGYCSSGGWLATTDSLIGYINTWPSELSPKGGYTRYVASADGLNWTDPANVLMSDGTPLNGIFEQDPHTLPNGRIVNSAHFQPGLHISPIYTDDASGVRGWKKGSFNYTNNSDKSQSIEMEPSIFSQSDGKLVMIFRDQNSSYHKLAASSTDFGETWSKAVQTNMPDARTKQSAGNLPDGTAYMAGNPVNNKRRVPLALTLSKDGKLFDIAYLLRGDDEIQPLRYAGKAKSTNSGYSYPKSMVAGDFLYISYATNKEDVQYTRVPLASISLNKDAIQTAASKSIRFSVSQRILSIHLIQNGASEIVIYDLTGHCLLHEKVYSDNFSSDLSGWADGIYLIHVSTEQGTYFNKIQLR